MERQLRAVGSRKRGGEEFLEDVGVIPVDGLDGVWEGPTDEDCESLEWGASHWGASDAADKAIQLGPKFVLQYGVAHKLSVASRLT